MSASLPPEQAFQRLAGLWTITDFNCPWGFDIPFINWIIDQNDLSILRSATVHEIFVMTCGLNTSLAEFEQATGYVPPRWPFSPKWDEDLTLGEFSVWLLAHSDLPTIEPLEIAGTSCKPGGIFLGLSEIVQRKTGRTRLRPSSVIASTLNPEELQVVLWQTQTATGRLVPGGEWDWRSSGCLSFTLTLLGAIGIIAAFLYENTTFFWLTVATMFAGLIHGIFVTYPSQAKRMQSLLPEGVVTFGDLVRVFAKQPAVDVTAKM